LRQALPIHEGDRVSMAGARPLEDKVKAAVAALPHVKEVQSNFVCCDAQGGLAAFVGVREDTVPPLRFRPPPTGAVRLPGDLIAADEALDQAMLKAVAAGRAQEDDSQGHALFTNDPDGRALQEQRVALAAQNLPLLRQVLRESADPRHRAMAAAYLGYAPDKQAVVDDLVYAANDADGGVRNNAVRALLVFALAEHPARVPYEPFIALLDSPVWTDLNKGSGALAALTQSRDPQLLALLKRRSLPQLATIARWRSRGHAYAAFLVLGRVAGYPENELPARFGAGDAETVIAAALRAGAQVPP
jgi:hypothetical protein